MDEMLPFTHFSAPLPRRWADAVFGGTASRSGDPLPIGVLRGEGIGPEVIAVALDVLGAVASVGGPPFTVTFGDSVAPSNADRSSPFIERVGGFCADIFARGGAILAGAVGGRFVYDLRRRFGLFCKLNPITTYAELAGASPLKATSFATVDVLVVRENFSGLYHGESVEPTTSEGGRCVRHTFGYQETEILPLLRVAARLASQRRGHLSVVAKEGGLPALSALWRRCAAEAAAEVGVEWSFLDVDYAAYRLVRHPQELDVVAAPNCFGDILADLGGILAGSRGLTFGGSFARQGWAVYQTNHGAAHDLAGTDRANPVGQIFSLAMLLRESFGLAHEAWLIEAAVSVVWRQGWRTADLAEPGCRTIGTQEMGKRIAGAVADLAARGAA